MEYYQSINSYFIKELEKVDVNDNVRAYLVSVFSKYKTSYYDLSDRSLTVEYSVAQFNKDFERFQNIGDWILYCNILFVEHLNNASPEYYISLGQMSYYNCYKVIRWKCFEELADRFIIISEDIKNTLR